MTTSQCRIAAILLLVCFSALVQAQSLFDDSSMRKEIAQRIAATHGIRLDWQRGTLMQLMDAELRLDTVRRIKQNHGVEYDWQKATLMQLMDAETRMDTAKRISRATGQSVDWRKYSLMQLMEMDLRASGVDVEAIKRAAAAKALAESSSGPSTAGAVVESKVDGEFEGWDGETVVKLMNGQIWKQTQYHYEYHYAYMPDVLIYKSGSIWKMKVEGTNKAVAVERLK